MAYNVPDDTEDTRLAMGALVALVGVLAISIAVCFAFGYIGFLFFIGILFTVSGIRVAWVANIKSKRRKLRRLGLQNLQN